MTAVHHAPPAEPSYDEERRPWTILVLALVAQVLVVLDISVVNTALPTIGHALSLRSGDLQWLVTAYLLLSGGGLLLGGRLADLFPRKRVFLTGLGVFTTASLASGFAGTAGVLIGARASQGLGAALMTPAAMSIIMTSYAGAQRARGLALWGLVGSMGVAAGVLLGGALTTWAGWQMIFWINVPIGVTVFVASLRLLPGERTAPGALAQLDLPGAATAVGSLATLLLAIQGTASHGWLSPRTLVLLGVSAVLATAFVSTERRAPRPLVPPHTWKVRTLVAGTTVMLGVTGLLVGSIFLTSVFLQTVLGMSALATGAAFLPFSLAVFGMSRITPQLIGWMGARAMIMIGSAALVVAYVWLSQISVTDSYFGAVFGPVLITGLASGLIFMPITTTVLGGVEPEHAGSASGLLQTTQQLGSAVGIAVIVSIYATGAVPGQFVPGIQAAFLTSAGFSLAAFLVAATALRTPRPPEPVVEEVEPELAEAA
jgi:EmrB/QacA subfamily drug resistance transporter